MFNCCNSPMSCLRKGVGIAILGALAVTAVGYVVMTLWNCLLPGLLGLKAIHFWQAVGLLVLSRLLFGGIHRGHGHRLHRRQRMLSRWESMTQEQREKFRHGFRCGCSKSSPEA